MEVTGKKCCHKDMSKIVEGKLIWSLEERGADLLLRGTMDGMTWQILTDRKNLKERNKDKEAIRSTFRAYGQRIKSER